MRRRPPPIGWHLYIAEKQRQQDKRLSVRLTDWLGWVAFLVICYLIVGNAALLLLRLIGSG